jgi:hypothetical protein
MQHLNHACRESRGALHPLDELSNELLGSGRQIAGQAFPTSVGSRLRAGDDSAKNLPLAGPLLCGQRPQAKVFS